MTDTLYCKVTDGAVVRGPEALPLHDEGVLNLRAADDPKVFGWYPVAMANVPEGQRLVDVSYMLAGDVVEQQGTLEPVPAPRPYFGPLSPAQLASALLLAEKITAQEAMDFGGAGIIPPPLLVSIEAAMVDAGLAETERAIALIKLRAATQYDRDSPLTPIMGVALGLDSAGLDRVWTIGAQV